MSTLRERAIAAWAKIERALDKVDALCSGTERWTMSVPVREDYDHDIVISGALAEARSILALLTEGGEPGHATLYRLRCGWCGAYEGTVDPGEACAQDPNTGEFIGPHEFGVYERAPSPVSTPEREGADALDVEALRFLRENMHLDTTKAGTVIGFVSVQGTRVRRAMVALDAILASSPTTKPETGGGS